MILQALIGAAVLAALGSVAQSRPTPPGAQTDARTRPVVETPHLTVSASSGPAAVAPGGRVSLFIDLTPKPKMHVYAPNQKDYIPVSITLESNPVVRTYAAVFPKAEKYFFAPLKETQFVYSRPFRIVQDVTVASAPALRKAGHAPGAPIVVTGKLRYQACDDAICYLPKDLPVSWTIGLKESPMQ